MPVAQAEVDRDDAVAEKEAAQPRGDLRFGQSRAGGGRQGDHDRTGRREQAADEAVRGIGVAEIGGMWTRSLAVVQKRASPTMTSPRDDPMPTLLPSPIWAYVGLVVVPPM